MSTPAPDSPLADRGTIDEALFAGQPAFFPSTVPVLPPEVVPGFVDSPAEELTPTEAPACGAVLDGATEYQMTGLAPGLFELRIVPPAPPVLPPPPFEDEEEGPAPDLPEAPAPHLYQPGEDEQPAGLEEAIVPAPSFTLAVNAGLELAPGEEVAIGPDVLCIDGAPTEQIDILLLTPPSHGALLRDGAALADGDTFTQQDLAAGRIRYRHDGGEAGQDSFLFATPEGDVQPALFHLSIQPTRRAPELLGPGQLAGVLDGCRVADVLAGQARCPQPDQAAGLALVAVAGRGQWFFSCDERQTWQDVGEIHPGQALLLGPEDGLRFVPREGWSGTVRVSYRAWDGSTGQAGEVADLAGLGALALSPATVSAVLRLPPATTCTADPCEEEPTLAELAGDGLAVVRLEGAGSWQYSLDDGRTWQPFGVVYHGRARLLRGRDRVRFLPRAGAAGKVLLAGRLWDGEGGTAGGTVNLAARTSHGDGTPFGEFVLTRTWWLRG